MSVRAALTIPFAPEEIPAEERDLLLLEQPRWSNCGQLTRLHLARYLRGLFRGEAESEGDDSPVHCCNYGSTLSLRVHVYPLAPGVRYRLLSTIGAEASVSVAQRVEMETVTFSLSRRASLRHPALAVRAARWLTGPWTTGGASVAAPALSVSGREVIAPIPLYGSVALSLDVLRYEHRLAVLFSVVLERLSNNMWSEWAMALPDGGRPVAVELSEPPGWAEMAVSGALCGRGQGSGDSGTIDTPSDDDDEEPEASGEDKHVKCDYCELKCDDPDKKNEGGAP